MHNDSIRTLIVNDVSAAINRWRDRIQRLRIDEPWAARWMQCSPAEYAEACAHKAIELADMNYRQVVDTGRAARFCLATKQPHAASEIAVGAIMARALAFGLTIHEVRKFTEGEHVARTLYPTSYRYFKALPNDSDTWTALAEVFDTPLFEELFGCAYSPRLVKTGSQIMTEFGLTAQELTAVWETGRKPIERHELSNAYGEDVAEAVLDGRDSYTWFRGSWPFGIHRITSGLMAFALRHNSLHDGQPIVILNGHFPGLSELFAAGLTIIEAGLPSGNLHIKHVRDWLIGHDNRPSVCAPGSIRRDAHEGWFPLDSPNITVDSRRNLVHCSDGLLAGAIEIKELLERTRSIGGLRYRLKSTGLTDEEIDYIVDSNPVIGTGTDAIRLTDTTRGQTLEDCVSTILQIVPPVFGAVNGYASGLTFACFQREITTAVNQLATGKAPVTTTEHARPLSTEPRQFSDLSLEDERAGLASMRESGIALVVPAGGTGGRFGGYNIPESDIRRQKALLSSFYINGRTRCGLDIRLANAVHWRAATNGQIPVAVMASPTNSQLVGDWCKSKRAEGLADLATYTQFGTYRLRADARPPGQGQPDSWWVNDIMRVKHGVPSLKPPGNLGTLTCLILSGIFNEWYSRGIQFLVVANGDDVGFRLEPKIIGFLRRHPEVDAVIGSVPWGWQGVLGTKGHEMRVRGDMSGWCVLDTGEQVTLSRTLDGFTAGAGQAQLSDLQDFSLDSGGWVCELPAGSEWRVGIVDLHESPEPGTKCLYNTNQFYIKTSSIARVMDLDTRTNLSAVTAFVAHEPFYVERKLVPVEATMKEALQLSQAMHGVFRHMSAVPLQITRFPSRGQTGGFAPLKTASDIKFGQIMLDIISSNTDMLLF